MTLFGMARLVLLSMSLAMGSNAMAGGDWKPEGSGPWFVALIRTEAQAGRPMYQVRVCKWSDPKNISACQPPFIGKREFTQEEIDGTLTRIQNLKTGEAAEVGRAVGAGAGCASGLIFGAGLPGCVVGAVVGYFFISYTIDTPNARVQ